MIITLAPSVDGFMARGIRLYWVFPRNLAPQAPAVPNPTRKKRSIGHGTPCCENIGSSIADRNQLDYAHEVKWRRGWYLVPADIHPARCTYARSFLGETIGLDSLAVAHIEHHIGLIGLDHTQIGTYLWLIYVA